MLYLYGSSRKTMTRRIDFMNAIFFPLMTMFIRPLSEILTQLSSLQGQERKRRAGLRAVQRQVGAAATRARVGRISEAL